MVNSSFGALMSTLKSALSGLHRGAVMPHDLVSDAMAAGDGTAFNREQQKDVKLKSQ